ncbi:MAG: PqqD family protein [Vicinamibacterales bacterium]
MTPMAREPRRFVLAPDVMLQDGSGEAILVKLDHESLFALNETGALVARRLIEGDDVDTIIADLARRYDAAAEAVAHDVRALVDALTARALIVPVESD